MVTLWGVPQVQRMSCFLLRSIVFKSLSAKVMGGQQGGCECESCALYVLALICYFAGGGRKHEESPVNSSPHRPNSHHNEPLHFVTFKE